MPCILCGSGETTVFYMKNRKRTKKFFHCMQCDFRFLDQDLLLEEEKEKERYLCHQNSEDNEGYVRWLKNIAIQTAEIISLSGMTVLDYGCGHNPVFPLVLKDIIPTVKLIEYYDLYFFPQQDWTKRYTCIFAIEVFEHFRRPYQEIERVCSLLEKGGYLILSTAFSPFSDDAFLSWWYIQDATHISFYSERTLLWMAQKFSLRLIFSNKNNLVIFQKL